MEVVVMVNKRLRILVVDDFPDAAAITQALLELRGYRCRSAVTGSEALAVAEAFDPDVVLLDLDLPDLSGFELARHLRARRGGVFLAALTGWADHQTRVSTAAAGFDDFLLKPMDGVGLERVLRSATRAHA